MTTLASLGRSGWQGSAVLLAALAFATGCTVV